MMSSSIRLKGIGLKIPKRSAPTTTFSYSNQPSLRFSYHRLLKSSGFQLRKHGCSLQYVRFRIRSMDEDSDSGIASFDWEDGEGTYGINSYISSGEESETELVINPIGDVDLPSSLHERFESSDGALAVTAHRFASLQGRFGTRRNQPGVFINMGLIAFVVVLLLLVDWCSWRIVRLPLAPFYLTRPFLLSAALASTAGYLCIPLLNSLRIHQTIRKEGPRKHSSKKGTPTLGGLFFVPIGIIVARYTVGFSSVEVFGVAAATSAFAAIGLLDDLFCVIKNQSDGLPAWVKVLLEVAVGTWFSFWLDSTNVSSPYSMYNFSQLV